MGVSFQQRARMAKDLGGGAAVATEPKLMTAEELLLLPDDRMDHELIRGELRTMPPPGFRHEAIALRGGARLLAFVEAHELGMVVGGPGFGSSADRTPSGPRIPPSSRQSASGRGFARQVPGPGPGPPTGGRLAQRQRPRGAGEDRAVFDGEDVLPGFTCPVREFFHG